MTLNVRRVTEEIRTRNWVEYGAQALMSQKPIPFRVDERLSVQVLDRDLPALRASAAQLTAELGQAEDSTERKVLAEALGTIEHPLAIAFLVKTLEHGESGAGVIAVKALSRFETPEALRGLLTALRHRDCDVRAAAIRAGTRYWDRPEFHDAFIPLLGDPDYTARERAIRALTGTTDPALWRRFAELVRDPSQEVRIAASDALGKTGSPSVVGDLQIAYDGEADSMVRHRLRAALTALGSPPAPLPDDAPSLAKLLDSPHEDERVAAVRKLGKLNTPEARQALVEALKSKCDDSRFYAIAEAQRLRLREAAGTLMELLNHSDPCTRRDAATALAVMKHTQAAPAIARLLFDSDSSVRLAVPACLSFLSDPSVIPALKEALKTEKAPKVAKEMRRAIKDLDRQRQGAKKERLGKPE